MKFCEWSERNQLHQIQKRTVMRKDRKVSGGLVLWVFGSFNPHPECTIQLLQNLIKPIALAIQCNYSAVKIRNQHSRNSAWGGTRCVSADCLWLAVSLSQFHLWETELFFGECWFLFYRKVWRNGACNQSSPEELYWCLGCSAAWARAVDSSEK